MAGVSNNDRRGGCDRVDCVSRIWRWSLLVSSSWVERVASIASGKSAIQLGMVSVGGRERVWGWDNGVGDKGLLGNIVASSRTRPFDSSYGSPR